MYIFNILLLNVFCAEVIFYDVNTMLSATISLPIGKLGIQNRQP